MKAFVRLGSQVLFFMAVSKGMNVITPLLQLPIPGSIIGMLLVFVLLLLGVIKLEWVEAGAAWLLAEMLLFFIPSAVGVLPYKSLLLGSGLQIVIVIVSSTALVMACAGLVAQGLAKIRDRGAS
ncbi:CidA/LrgA family holin-like protein [Paenibacillus chartarius]|uniref:CidA/LrgA family holin-like protein n=1 Tax=Paenibacillus chartarius TaxID=747481 RepID=A0ABV6DPM1_9BACL